MVRLCGLRGGGMVRLCGSRGRRDNQAVRIEGAEG